MTEGEDIVQDLEVNQEVDQLKEIIIEKGESI